MAVVFRPAEDGDLDAMATIRAREWETEEYWKRRIGGYMAVELSPHQALRARAVFVAVADGSVVGFVAGHRTRRYGCDGELEWINVAPEQRGRGIAGQLLAVMAAWFVEQGALRVCVDVEPKNTVARGLYARYGAERLNNHWMLWEDARAIGTRYSNRKWRIL
jgi:predicted GNAT family acetyltransferase